MTSQTQDTGDIGTPGRLPGYETATCVVSLERPVFEAPKQRGGADAQSLSQEMY
jgi:hypothetical protein